MRQVDGKGLEESRKHKWLKSRVQVLRARLGDAEAALEAFERNPDDLSWTEGTDLFWPTSECTAQRGALMTKEGTIISVDPKMAEMLKVSVEQMLGGGLAEWVLPHDRPHFEALLRAGLNKKSRKSSRAAVPGSFGQLTLRDSEGNELPVLVTFASLDWNGACARLLVVDVSERKRQQERLASESLARSILNQVEEAIVVCDGDGTIIRASQAAARLAGREVVHESFTKALPLRLPEGGAFPLGSVLQGEILQGFEVTLARGTETLILHLTAGPLIAADERPLGCVMTLIDITPRKQFEDMLQRQSQALARSNADLQQFAYVASHDLQEPLRMVTNFVRLLKQRYGGKLGPDADDFIEYAAEGALRMYTLINDLLAYSRLDQRPIELRQLDAATLLATALTNLKSSIEQHGALVTAGELPKVVVDGAQMIEVLQHLVGNAIKFRGNAVPRVHIDAQSKGSHFLFSVRDNGIGIEPQYVERIFTIFQRLHTRSEYPGNGIGLSMCKRIVERHGGRIWVVSVPGQGATFYFTLPVRKPSETRAPRASDDIVSPLTPLTPH